MLLSNLLMKSAPSTNLFRPKLIKIPKIYSTISMANKSCSIGPRLPV